MDEKQKVLDILNKFSFILGQRAGRELWLDKPEKVQDEDLLNFNKDIEYIRAYVESSNQPIWHKIKDNILPPINTHVIGAIFYIMQQVGITIRVVGTMPTMQTVMQN